MRCNLTRDALGQSPTETDRSGVMENAWVQGQTDLVLHPGSAPYYSVTAGKLLNFF